VVEADLRTPRRDRLAGYVDVSILDVGFLFEGPVGAGSFALAARRSWVDAILTAVIPDDADIGFTTAPRYWDYQAILAYPVAGGNLRLAAFGSHDALALVLDDPSEIDPAIRGSISSTTYVQRLQATWSRKLGERTEVLASVSQGVNSLYAALGDTLRFDLTAFLNSYRFEVAHRPMPGVKVTVGAEGLVIPYHIAAELPRLPDEGDLPTPVSAQELLVQDRTDWDWRAGFYGEAQLELPGGVTVTPGTHAEWVRSMGAWHVDPRLAARWTGGGNTVRAGVGRYSQQPFEGLTDPTFGNPELRGERAIHYSAGYDRQVTPSIKLETTLFWKTLSDLITRDPANTVRGGMVVPVGYANQGTGRVYGAEVLARWQGRGPVFGWLSYTLSRSERKDTPEEDSRLFSFDQTHILTAVGSLALPWGLVGGLRFRLVSGNPDTPIIGSLYDADADVYVPLPGAANSQRLPIFHQLDARLERKFTFDSWELTAYLDVQNVYNNAAAEGVVYNYNYSQRQLQTGIPIIPSIGLRGEL
jgi:hypothetical protein